MKVLVIWRVLQKSSNLAVYSEFVYKRIDNFGPKMACRTDVSQYDVVESLIKVEKIFQISF